MKNILSSKSNNVFAGDNAILDYLNPDNSIPTPLVELPQELNKYKQDGVRIYAKLMNVLPLGNVKSLPALNMILNEKRNGGLENIDTIIENSSGNTVLSLSVLGRHMGIKNITAVVSHEVSLGKLNLLRFLNTEIIVNKEPICPDPTDKSSGIYKSKVWAKENNWFNPGQYDNLANPDAHYKWTGPQIWDQTSGEIDVLVSGLGTTGTIYGLGKFFKEQNPNVKVVGIARAANNPVPGVRTKSLLREIAFPWNDKVDKVFEGNTHDSFELSLKLSRAGILIGPSSGLSLIGVYKYLEALASEDRKNLNIVFICPDSPSAYIDEYFEVLGEGYFPKIMNKELLLNTKLTKENPGTSVFEVREIETKQVFPELGNNLFIIDVRKEEEYFDHHISGSINVPVDKLNTYVNDNLVHLKSFNKIVCVCRRGNTSKVAVEILHNYNLHSYSMAGGMEKWSAEDLPRIKPKGCHLKN